MFRRLSLYAASCLVALLAPATWAPAAHLNVFLMAGQSNMAGSINVQLPSFPQDQATVLPDVLFTQDTSASAGVTYVEPLGPLQPRATFQGGSNRRWSGQELTFADTLRDAGVQDLAVIKYARNGTTLAESWEPGGTLRTNFYTFVDDALSQLAGQGHTYELAGFIWVQGNGDAGVLENAEAYDANLNAFIAEVEGRYGQTTTVINRYHVNGRPAFSDELRARQRLAADANPRLFSTDNDDLGLNSDRVHFTDNTELESGRRLAERWLSAQHAPGDYNGDGSIDAADYTMWRDGLELYVPSRPDLLAADADGDGFIEAGENPWLVASAAAGMAIPEPASIVGLLCLATVIGSRRRPDAVA